MGKQREIACQYYVHEGECLKGRKGTFYDACQICKKYAPVRGGAPARKNNKRQLLERAKKLDEFNY